MFKMRLTINEAMFQRLRELPDRAKRVFKARLRTELLPELEQLALSLFADGPLPVSSPFQFGSDASRRYYFWLVAQNPNMIYEEGGYKRSGIIEEGWRVNIQDRLGKDMISLTNIQVSKTPRGYTLGVDQKRGEYLYAFATPGHEATGWNWQLQLNRIALHEKAMERVAEIWRESVRESKAAR